MPDEDVTKTELEVKDEVKEELSADDIFDQAFDEILAKEVTDEEKPPEDEKKDDEALKEEQKIQDGEKGEEPPPAEKVQPPAEEKKEEPPQPPAKEEARAPEPPPEKEVVKKETAPEKELPPPDYSLLWRDIEKDITDEAVKKELAEYEDNMDAVSKFEGIKRDLVAKRLVNYVNESFKVLVEKLQPFMQASVNYIETVHNSSVEAIHSDVGQLRRTGEILAWIKEQPKYMQSGMMRVYENGEPPDVIDLITRYKEAKGLHKKEEPDLQLDKKNEAQKKIDEKVANLSAVKTKTGPINVSDRKPKAGAEDFDGAFEEAEVSKRR